jgi:chromosomal replication initiator protein
MIHRHTPGYLLDIEPIITHVAKRLRVPIEELKGPRRGQHTALCRQIAFFLIRDMTHRSYPQIGAYFGRDHSTVIHGCNLIINRIAREPEFAETIRYLRHELTDETCFKEDGWVGTLA